MPHAVHIKIHKFIIKNGLVSLFRLSVYAEASAPGVDADVLPKFAMNIQKVHCRRFEGSAPSHSTPGICRSRLRWGSGGAEQRKAFVI